MLTQMIHKLTARALIRDYEDGILHENATNHEVCSFHSKNLCALSMVLLKWAFPRTWRVRLAGWSYMQYQGHVLSCRGAGCSVASWELCGDCAHQREAGGGLWEYLSSELLRAVDGHSPLVLMKSQVQDRWATSLWTHCAEKATLLPPV